MEIKEFPNCCSAVLIMDFYDRTDTITPLQRKQHLLSKLQDYFEYYIEDESITDYPKTFFATTNSNSQYKWEVILKELGFKARKFASRHAKTSSDKYLNFWSLYTIPKDLKPWLRNEIKQHKQRMKK